MGRASDPSATGREDGSLGEEVSGRKGRPGRRDKWPQWASGREERGEEPPGVPGSQVSRETETGTSGWGFHR